MTKITGETLTEVFTAYGEKGLALRKVAEDAVEQTKKYLMGNYPVGEYLADQLLIPMAIAGGGQFVTCKPSLHTKTNIAVIKEFLDVDIEVRQLQEDKCEISVKQG